MPITKSAEKALRQSLKRKKENLQRKEAMKKAIKDIQKLLLAGKKKEALKLVAKTYKAIDKAVKRGIIKKNNANRKKSRLMKSILKSSK